MKATSNKNCKVGAAMSFFSAVCFAGSAIFFAKSPTPNMALVFSAIAILNGVVGVILLKKSKQP
jgi:hypothetical protein